MHQLADVMNVIILITVTPCSISICASLFVIETVNFSIVLADGWWRDHCSFMFFAFFWLFKLFQFNEIGETFYPMAVIISELETLFIFFYFGQMCHSNLINLGDLIYKSDWHHYPHSVQRCVLMMIMRAQQPFYISAYGIIRCDLETFLAVSRKNNCFSEHSSNKNW